MPEKPPLLGPSARQEDPTLDHNPRIEGRGFHIELGQDTRTNDTDVNLQPGAHEADVAGEISPKKSGPATVEPEQDEFDDEEVTQVTDVPEGFGGYEKRFEPDKDTLIVDGEELQPLPTPESYSPSTPPGMEMSRMNIPPEPSKEEEEEEEEKIEVVELDLDKGAPMLDAAAARSERLKETAIKAKGDQLAKQMLQKHRADAAAARKELKEMKGVEPSTRDKVIDAALETLKGL